MTSFANYKDAIRDAGYLTNSQEIKDTALVVELEDRFYMLCKDENGEREGDYMVGTFLKGPGDYMGIPVWEGSLEECLNWLKYNA